MYPGISEAMSRLLHVVLEPIYDPIRPRRPISVNEDLLPAPYSNLNFRQSTQKGLGKKPYIPKFSFFYRDWDVGLVNISDFNSAVKVLRVLLGIVGPHLWKDIRLVYKLIRIGKAHVTTEVSLLFS
jgi:hypothetical protein